MFVAFYTFSLLVFAPGLTNVFFPDFPLTDLSEIERIPIAAGISVFLYLIAEKMMSATRLKVEDFSRERLKSSLDTKLESLIASLKQELRASRPDNISQITPEDKSDIVNRIVESSSINITDDTFKLIKRDQADQELANLEERILRRLENQVEILGYRANFSLYWGLILAAAGLAALYLSFYAFTPEIDYKNIYSVISHYAPRLSAIIIIEVIAFFFLKLYARTLGDLKYVQNEITNVESKLIGLRTAISNSNATILKKAIEVFLETERNFILSKGQTTMEIEKERADSQGMAATLSAAAELLHGRGSQKSHSKSRARRK